MRTALSAFVLSALSFVVAAPAQRASGGPDPDRKACTVVVQDDDHGVLAAVSVSYTPAEWRNGYSEMIPKLRGNNYSRIGKGWWATLETAGAIEIGGARVEAGTWYLGLRCAQDGAFSLVLYDSKRAMQQRMLPFATPLCTGEVKADLVAPLVFTQDARKEPATSLALEIAADAKDPTKGTLALRWGPHEAVATVKFDLAGAKAGTGR